MLKPKSEMQLFHNILIKGKHREGLFHEEKNCLQQHL